MLSTGNFLKVAKSWASKAELPPSDIGPDIENEYKPLSAELNIAILVLDNTDICTLDSGGGY